MFGVIEDGHTTLSIFSVFYRMANNGSGFLPAAPLQENVKLPEIPPPETPVYNELLSKISPIDGMNATGIKKFVIGVPGSYPQINTSKLNRHGHPIDEGIYWEYVDKLIKAYPMCKLERRDLEPGSSDPGGRARRAAAEALAAFTVTEPQGHIQRRQLEAQRRQLEAAAVAATLSRGFHQPFTASRGQNYFRLFDETEKSCFLQPFIEARKKAEAEQEKIKKEKKVRNNYEKRRLAKVPMGNLLGLNKPPQPNLLSFEPTKNGLNARAKELAGLFGGRRKTRRGRKHRRHSTRRKN
jgi:hypothetical protein